MEEKSTLITLPNGIDKDSEIDPVYEMQYYAPEVRKKLSDEIRDKDSQWEIISYIFKAEFYYPFFKGETELKVNRFFTLLVPLSIFLSLFLMILYFFTHYEENILSNLMEAIFPFGMVIFMMLIIVSLEMTLKFLVNKLCKEELPADMEILNKYKLDWNKKPSAQDSGVNTAAGIVKTLRLYIHGDLLFPKYKPNTSQVFIALIPALIQSLISPMLRVFEGENFFAITRAGFGGDPDDPIYTYDIVITILAIVVNFTSFFWICLVMESVLRSTYSLVNRERLVSYMLTSPITERDSFFTRKFVKKLGNLADNLQLFVSENQSIRNVTDKGGRTSEFTKRRLYFSSDNLIAWFKVKQHFKTFRRLRSIPLELVMFYTLVGVFIFLLYALLVWFSSIIGQIPSDSFPIRNLILVAAFDLLVASWQLLRVLYVGCTITALEKWQTKSLRIFHLLNRQYLFLERNNLSEQELNNRLNFEKQIDVLENWKQFDDTPFTFLGVEVSTTKLVGFFAVALSALVTNVMKFISANQ